MVLHGKYAVTLSDPEGFQEVETRHEVRVAALHAPSMGEGKGAHMGL